MSSEESVSASRIVLIDDQRAFTDALTLALSLTGDLRVVSAEVDARNGLQSIEAAEPDLVVTGYRLCGKTTGIDIARETRERQRNADAEDSTPFVILTAFPTPTVARQAEELTGVTVLTKRSPVTEIVAALRRAITGEYTEPAVVSDPFSLSPAELEVLDFLASGMTATMIADRLCLSVHAIRARIRGLLTKTDSTSQLEAVTKATRAGLVVPPSYEAPHSEFAPSVISA